MYSIGVYVLPDKTTVLGCYFVRGIYCNLMLRIYLSWSFFWNCNLFYKQINRVNIINHYYWIILTSLNKCLKLIHCTDTTESNNSQWIHKINTIRNVQFGRKTVYPMEYLSVQELMWCSERWRVRSEEGQLIGGTLVWVLSLFISAARTKGQNCGLDSTLNIVGGHFVFSTLKSNR